jgi:hypothetical protein
MTSTCARSRQRKATAPLAGLHADAGVPIDVLAELLDHRSLNVTRGYYRVGEERRRAAVDKVTAMQFDRHGNRVWRDARALLDDEHARYAVGSVAVPYGTCTEPSNSARNVMFGRRGHCGERTSDAERVAYLLLGAAR